MLIQLSTETAAISLLLILLPQLTLMKQIYLLLLLSFCLAVPALQAQNTNWRTPEDYLRDTAQVALTIRWLENNAFPENFKERKEKAAYVYKWLEGAPYTVKVESVFIESIMNDKSFAYKDMIVPQFVFGKGLYLIESHGDKNDLKANMRGLKSIIKLYSQIKAKDVRAKNKTLDKYAALAAKNELEAYVRKQMRL